MQGMIMHVMFNRSHTTVRNVQERCCHKTGYRLSYLSSVDAQLAVDSLLLTDVDMPD